jgi:hypothetical protein
VDFQTLYNRAHSCFILFEKSSSEGEKQAAYKAWQRIVGRINRQFSKNLTEDDFKSSSGKSDNSTREKRRSSTNSYYRYTSRDDTSAHEEANTYNDFGFHNFYDDIGSDPFESFRRAKEKHDAYERSQKRAKEREFWYRHKRATAKQMNFIRVICNEFNLEFPDRDLTAEEASKFLSYWAIAFNNFKKYRDKFQSEYCNRRNKWWKDIPY